MNKNALSTFALCSTLVLLTACGGSEGTSSDSTMNDTNNGSSSSDSGTTTTPDTGTTTTPIVDTFGKYDLGQYILVQQTGTLIRNRYREEDGSVTSPSPLQVDVNEPMQAGTWIEDEIGFTDSLKIVRYRVNDEDINVVVQTGIAPLLIEQQLNLKRFVGIGEDTFIDVELNNVPITASIVLENHYDTFNSLLQGNVERTDYDVVSMNVDVEVGTINTRLDIRLGRDLGVVSGTDRDCVRTLFGLQIGVNDDLADSECDIIRTDNIILDGQIFRQ